MVKSYISEESSDIHYSDESSISVKSKKNTKKSKKYDIVEESTTYESSEDIRSEKDESSETETDSSNDESSDDKKTKRIKRAQENLDTYDSDDIRNIIYEDIDNKYAYGRIGPFNVIIMKKNGYINATKLCKDADKRYPDWSVLKDSKGLFKVAKKMKSKFGTDPLEIKIKKGKLTRGTYIHSKLITQIATWCSHEYSIMVSDIVEDFHLKKINEENRKIVGEKDDKIDQLTKLVNTLQKNNEIARKENEIAFTGLKKDTGKIINQNTKLTGKVVKLDTKVVKLDSKLDNACNQRVVNNVPNSDNMLIIFKNNDVYNKKKPDRVLYQFSVKRVMKKCYNQTRKEHMKEHPNMEVFDKYKYAPNSAVLWVNIKKNLKKKIECHGGNVNLKKKYKEKQFKKDVEDIFNERFDKDNI